MSTRRVFGSLLSALAGTVAGAAVTSMSLGAWWQPGVVVLAVAVTACSVLPVWLLLVLPLYLLVPRTSLLWRPILCTPAGALIGAAVLAAYGALAWPDWQAARVLFPIAAVVGGVTALFASLTAHRFDDDAQRVHAKA